MLDSLHNNWKDETLSNDSHDRLNLHSDAVVSIMYEYLNPDENEVLRNLRDNLKMSLVGKSKVSEELILIHHVMEASNRHSRQ